MFFGTTDPHLLVAQLHRQALLCASHVAKAKFQGLASAAKPLGVSNSWKRRLRELDSTLGMVEKVTAQSCEQWLQCFAAELKRVGHDIASLPCPPPPLYRARSDLGSDFYASSSSGGDDIQISNVSASAYGAVGVTQHSTTVVMKCKAFTAWRCTVNDAKRGSGDDGFSPPGGPQISRSLSTVGYANSHDQSNAEHLDDIAYSDSAFEGEGHVTPKSMFQKRQHSTSYHDVDPSMRGASYTNPDNLRGCYVHLPELVHSLADCAVAAVVEAGGSSQDAQDVKQRVLDNVLRHSRWVPASYQPPAGAKISLGVQTLDEGSAELIANVEEVDSLQMWWGGDDNQIEPHVSTAPALEECTRLVVNQQRFVPSSPEGCSKEPASAGNAAQGKHVSAIGESIAMVSSSPTPIRCGGTSLITESKESTKPTVLAGMRPPPPEMSECPRDPHDSPCATFTLISGGTSLIAGPQELPMPTVLAATCPIPSVMSECPHDPHDSPGATCVINSNPSGTIDYDVPCAPCIMCGGTGMQGFSTCVWCKAKAECSSLPLTDVIFPSKALVDNQVICPSKALADNQGFGDSEKTVNSHFGSRNYDKGDLQGPSVVIVGGSTRIPRVQAIEAVKSQEGCGGTSLITESKESTKPTVLAGMCPPPPEMSECLPDPHKSPCATYTERKKLLVADRLFNRWVAEHLAQYGKISPARRKFLRREAVDCTETVIARQH